MSRHLCARAFRPVAQSLARKPRVKYFRPKLDSLEDRTVPTVGADVRTALDAALPVLNTALSGEVFGVEIPIVGSALKNTGIASSVAGLKTNLDNNAFDSETDVTKIAGELTAALGSPYTVTATPDTPNAGDTKFTIHRADTLATISSGSFHFDVGLKGLGLNTSGTGLTIKLGDEFNLSFVVPQSGNPYFVATGGGKHDFSLTANLSIPNFSATGTLGLFQVDIKEDKADNPGNDTGLPTQGASGFNPTFNFDLPSGQLSPSDIANVKASLSGTATVNLGMVVSFGGSTQFPSFRTNFHLNWDLDSSDTTQALGSEPTVQFKNVEVDAGSYISDFLAPILRDIQTVTRPLQPLIDVLETPVPVISDLLGHKETFLDMVGLLTGNSGGDTVSFIKSVVQIINLVNSIPTDPGLKDIEIPFGDFDLGGLTDVRNAAPGDLKNLDLSSLSNSSFFSNLISNLQGAGGLSSTVADFLSKSEGGEGGSFQASFPIIDNPISVFGLFLGKPVDLFDLTLPDLSFGGNFDEFFPVLGPLGVELKGGLSATFHLKMGYDSLGLTSGDPLQGFFISDDSSANISASIHAYAALNVVVFSAGVGGGIDANIDFKPHDPDDDGQGSDGKLRPKEIGEDLSMGSFCLFNVDGKITASLDAFIKVGFDTPFGFVGWSDDYTIAQATLLDFSAGCAHGFDGTPQPTLGHISTGSGEDTGIPAGYLILNTGPYAGDRGVGDTSDEDENFTVTHLGGTAGDESVQIDGMGSTSKPFDHVKGIYAEGGDGNNIITIKAGTLSPVTLYGGFNNTLHPGPHNPPGHNQLYSADGPATLYAGDGGDHIVAGSGDANIYGGLGDDDLVGGTGKCYIKAGPGHSKLRGGGGVSTLDGNNGASDIETAGSGDDILIGGTGGNNTFIVNDPNNTILASAGPGISITGKGASNQLIIFGKGDSSFAETYNYGPGNGDGTIATTNGTVSQMITYTGLAPIFDSLGAGSATLNATGGADTIDVGDASSGFQFNSDNSPTGNNLYVRIDSFEHTLLDNKTTVNIDGNGGGDTATVDSQQAADGLANLNLFLGSGTNTANVQATPAGVVTTVDGTAAGAATTFNVGSLAPILTGGIVGNIDGSLVIDGSGTDTANVDDTGDTTDRTDGLLTDTKLTGLGMAGSITYAGLAALNVNLGSGNDSFEETGIAPSTVTTVDGGPGTDTYDGNFPGNFAGTLFVKHFENITMEVADDFSGSFTASDPGNVQSIAIGGSLTTTGTIRADNIDSMTVGQDYAGTVNVTQDIGLLAIGGTMTNTGLVQTGGDLDEMTIGPDMYSPGHDMAGRIIVGGTLGDLRVAGATPGTIQAGHIGTIRVYGGFGPLMLQVKENGIQRRVEVAVPSNPYPLVAPPPAPPPPQSPADVRFQYVYEGSLANPQMTIRAFNTSGNTRPDQYDLSLVVYNDAAKFNLARLDADGLSGLRNVDVEGDILTSVTPGKVANFFKVGTGIDTNPAGVRLPLDKLAGVGVRDYVPNGSIQAASIQAVAFGSHTSVKGVIEPGAVAIASDAASLLTPGTALVQAIDTFRVPFADLATQQVALFLVTLPTGGRFDSNNIILVVQGVSRPNADGTANIVTPSNAARGAVTALVTTVPTFDKFGRGLGSVVKSIDLRGDGGSILSKQAITNSITSTGPLGDLTLLAGAVPSVTAPSIFGSIIAVGSINKIVQTTGLRTDPITGAVNSITPDLGRPYVDTSGKVPVVAATVIQPGAIGTAGEVISRGDLISFINTNGGNFDGLAAAQGNLGKTFTSSAGQSTRLGGILSNGRFSGSIVVLGYVISDMRFNGGPYFTGRIAAKGGILGNVLIGGGIDTPAAIVSGGEIGDPTLGTKLTLNGTNKGILAAKGAMNFGGAAPGGSVFNNVGNSGPNASAIDAIFTDHGSALSFDIGPLDLAGLGLILTDLHALKVGPGGTLTGPVP